MSNPIGAYLKYAHVQMAAEAFLQAGISGNDYERALLAGNEFSSKFTDTLADEFIANWEVVAHQPNTPSGFSGTIFRGRAGGPYAGELVLSFRSTEFIGDAMRDSFVTNRGINEHGWAFVQISDMREWWESAEVQEVIGTQGVTVTGYSLGGHLANAFYLLNPGIVRATYTFNGAGTGVLKEGSLHQLIDLFKTIAHNTWGNTELPGHPEVRALYLEMVDRQLHQSSSARSEEAA